MSQASNEDIIAHFNLLQAITRADRHTSLDANMTKLEEFVYHKFQHEMEQFAPPHFAHLLFDFQNEFKKLKDFLSHTPLINKKVVALGGGFSSGKSTFLNKMLGKNVLPAKIDPSTSVPTYIVSGEDEQLQATNIFQTNVELQLQDLKRIAHGFGEVTNEDHEVMTEEITLGHLLEHLFLQTPKHPFHNIAFLDTPGYSKPDTEGYSLKTDEQIARAQLNTADYILWFVPADGGTITAEDIQFIKSLHREIPLCIVLSKADKKITDDLIQIKQNIKETLNIQGVPYVDIFCFTRRKAGHEDEEQLKELLEQLNTQSTHQKFVFNFDKVFSACREYYEDQQNIESRRLHHLNKVATLANMEVIEQLEPLMAETKSQLRSLKNIKEKLELLRQEFLAQLERITDHYQINLLNEVEVEEMKKRIVSTLQTIQSYNKKNKRVVNYDASGVLTQLMANYRLTFHEKSEHAYKVQQVAQVVEEGKVEEENLPFHYYLHRKTSIFESIEAIMNTDKE